MPESSEIPYLLNLLDDDSEEIRDRIREALAGFGPALEKEVWPYRHLLDSEKSAQMEALYRTLRIRQFEQTWPAWLDVAGYAAPLEMAFSDLAQLDFGYSRPALSDLIDDLAEQFIALSAGHNSQALLHFLFHVKRMAPPQSAYYEPLNSNLVHVIESRTGIQISLAAIAILVGHRLNIEFFGLNVPGHFMLMATGTPEPLVLDPFNQGRPIPDTTIDYLRHALRLDSYQALLALKASPAGMILRVLRNLVNAWDRKGDQSQSDFYKKTSNTLIEAIRARNMA